MYPFTDFIVIDVFKNAFGKALGVVYLFFIINQKISLFKFNFNLVISKEKVKLYNA